MSKPIPCEHLGPSVLAWDCLPVPNQAFLKNIKKTLEKGGLDSRLVKDRLHAFFFKRINIVLVSLKVILNFY